MQSVPDDVILDEVVEDLLDDEVVVERLAAVMDKAGLVAKEVLVVERMVGRELRAVTTKAMIATVEKLLRRNKLLNFVTEYEDTVGETYYCLGDDGDGLRCASSDFLELLQNMLGNRDIAMKQCRASGCRLWKPYYQFSKSKSSSDGRNNRCKACERARVAAYEKRKDISRKCSQCKRLKPFSEFGKNTAKPQGHKYICKRCEKKARDAREKN